MKERVKIVILAVAVAISALTVGICALAETEKTHEKNQPISSKISSLTKKDYYILKEYEGRVAIYKNDESNPDEVLDVYIADLPERDIERIKAGIKAETKEEMIKIAEDYE